MKCKGVFITDCEGPITKNDNAFELCTHFLPQGDRFFTLISRYDDILADIVKRENYKPGDTLKLILPFLKAYGVRDESMKEFSKKSLLLVPKADELLKSVKDLMPSFIVSTSYEHYISALCELLGFPFENTYSTRVSLNSYKIQYDEAQRLKELQREILELEIDIPEGAVSFEDLSSKTQKAVEKLDMIFWEEIKHMKIGRIFEEVNPIGGNEKVRAVKEILEKLNLDVSETIYVGDSITDVESLRFVRENGGVAISFNGNGYALREAEIAIISNQASITLLLARIFCEYGKDGLLDFVKSFPEGLRSSSNETVEIHLITRENFDEIVQRSKEMRKTVRGEKIGNLG
jgi:energy-converting hydrogenase A subunit R